MWHKAERVKGSKSLLSRNWSSGINLVTIIWRRSSSPYFCLIDLQIFFLETFESCRKVISISWQVPFWNLLRLCLVYLHQFSCLWSLSSSLSVIYLLCLLSIYLSIHLLYAIYLNVFTSYMLSNSLPYLYLLR